MPFFAKIYRLHSSSTWRCWMKRSGRVRVCYLPRSRNAIRHSPNMLKDTHNQPPWEGASMYHVWRILDPIPRPCLGPILRTPYNRFGDPPPQNGTDVICGCPLICLPFITRGMIQENRTGKILLSTRHRMRSVNEFRIKMGKECGFGLFTILSPFSDAKRDEIWRREKTVKGHAWGKELTYLEGCSKTMPSLIKEITH